MSSPEGHILQEEVVREIEKLWEAGEIEPVKVEPRCWVCCEQDSRDLVNRLIANGLSNREIVTACGDINRRRLVAADERLISARHVWNHRRLHFNVDEPTQNALREILERRAAEVGRDYINGVTHAVTPYALIEAAMVKGYQHLADNASVVSVKDAILAASKLHEMSMSDAESRSRAQMLAKLDRIISAAQDLIPLDFHEEFLARVEGRPYRRAISVPEPTDDVREFTPDIRMDEGDTL